MFSASSSFCNKERVHHLDRYWISSLPVESQSICEKSSGSLVTKDDVNHDLNRVVVLSPRSHDAGTKLYRHKMNAVCLATVHTMPVRCRFRVWFFSYLNFTLIT